MTTDADLCAYSDLPHNQCDHCRTTNTGTTRTRITTPPPTPHRPMRVVHPIATQPPTTKPRGRNLPQDTKHWETPDYITALCDHTHTTEHYNRLTPDTNGTLTSNAHHHHTTNPPLLEQLWSAAETSRGMDSGNTRAFGSSPAASLEALDVAIEIERDVHKMLRALGERDTHDHWPDTIAAVRHLGALITPGQFTTHRDEAHTIRRWWSAARVITGWDLPAFKPHNTCPVCSTLGSLRIKWPTGLCTTCRTVWDADMVGLLVEHIRLENDEDGLSATHQDETA